MPTVTLVTDAFTGLAAQLAKSMGNPDLMMVVIEHPLGGIEPDGSAARRHIGSSRGRDEGV